MLLKQYWYEFSNAVIFRKLKPIKRTAEDPDDDPSSLNPNSEGIDGNVGLKWVLLLPAGFYVFSNRWGSPMCEH